MNCSNMYCYQDLSSVCVMVNPILLKFVLWLSRSPSGLTCGPEVPAVFFWATVTQTGTRAEVAAPASCGWEKLCNTSLFFSFDPLID